ncbi:hypothetical protein PanWU01x14_077740 [Parasponia andersonii]|uniref:Uncharacterized protein n=1 Tax=Parasponia andersonii TaxID=3476 RepID=A0A2P5DBT1_PARAD|nr:hypothetical protein PanWU01x14_077740 [Parasponia andersonii]
MKKKKKRWWKALEGNRGMQSANSEARELLTFLMVRVLEEEGFQEEEEEEVAAYQCREKKTTVTMNSFGVKEVDMGVGLAGSSIEFSTTKKDRWTNNHKTLAPPRGSFDSCLGHLYGPSPGRGP